MSPNAVRTGRSATRVAIIVTLLVTVLLVAGWVVINRDDGGLPRVDLDSGWTWQPQEGQLELGITHTQESLNSGSAPAATDRARSVLVDAGHSWQNQHLMGFGALNPEPSPGVYDWASLDARMTLIRDTGGSTVLTACCAPDWMKGGSAGATDWSRLETAPDPAYFDRFAALTAAAVARYPQIRAVMVWNELKGFFHPELNRWDYEGYTDLYNAVYRAVKAVRPDVLVGGPYAPVTSVVPGSHFASTGLMGAWGAADQRVLDVIDYWLRHAVGADFVVVDGPTSIGGIGSGQPPATVDAGTSKYAAVTTWVRQRTTLPVWWAEFYPDVPAGARGGADSPASAAATLSAIAEFAGSGAAVALLWGPEGSSLAYSALWTSTAEDPDGGRPTPLTSAWDWLVPKLAAGHLEIGRSDTTPLLAFRDPDGAVVVNPTGADVPLPGTGRPFPAWAASIEAT